MEAIGVLVVDDNAQFRSGLRALLTSAPGVELAGEASNGQEAITLAERLQPDVILMDISMPGLDGLETTRRILRVSPHIGVLMLTMLEDDDSVFEALQAGARGYLLKGALRAEILRAIRGVSSGEAIFGPAIARRLGQFFSMPRPDRYADAFPELTERERGILRLLADQRTNAEIAAKLSLAPKTVRNHVSNIFAKLQVASRAEVIIRARDAGNLAPPGR
ncbi:MAG: response regulator transcription factor [Actinomycetota bacterium]|nr:response regulator transcription factor [Actinomycetota bacterium]